jgi:hypothetical protein
MWMLFEMGSGNDVMVVMRRRARGSLTGNAYRHLLGLAANELEKHNEPSCNRRSSAVVGRCIYVSFGQPGASELLKLEATIPIADVQGRIDHLSIDLMGQRLFVAALGNNSLEVIDLKKSKQVNSIHGLAEPQGIAYIHSSNLLFVTNGKDGSVRAFDASSWKMLNSIPYGEDAGNLRHDPSNGHI